MSRKIENSKRIWKRVFPSLFHIHSATFRESNWITVITGSSILHFTLHENIPVLMGICSAQICGMVRKKEMIYIYIYIYIIFCSVFVIFVMEGESISRP